MTTNRTDIFFFGGSTLSREGFVFQANFSFFLKVAKQREA